MKKILFLLGFFLTCAGAFSLSDYKGTTLSVGAVFPYMNQNFKVDGQDTIILNGTGINLNFRHQNNGYDFGIFVDSDVFFPTSKTQIDPVTNQSKTAKLTNYDYFFGVDVLAGVYTVLFKSSGLNVPFGGGIHMDSYASKVKEKNRETAYTLGFGGWINCEINVSDHFGVYGGLKLTYDFYGKQKLGGESNDGQISAWSLVPAVGVAFHL